MLFSTVLRIKSERRGQKKEKRASSRITFAKARLEKGMNRGGSQDIKKGQLLRGIH